MPDRKIKLHLEEKEASMAPVIHLGANDIIENRPFTHPAYIIFDYQSNPLWRATRDVQIS